MSVIDDILPTQSIIKPIQNKINTHSSAANKTNLLKSKINKIKLQNTAKWNQLMVSTHTKQQKQTEKCENSVQSTHSLLSQMDRDRDTNNGNFSDNVCDKISNDIDSETENGENMCEFEFEGSLLGLSLSTTPILYTPLSPNNIMREVTNDEFTDFWDLDLNNEFIELSDHNLNSVHCVKKKSSHWISCFGSKIVRNGQRHSWKIKILSRDNNKYNTEIANVVIGVCDQRNIKTNIGGFWTHPFFGYGYTGASGHKLNGNKHSQMYGSKYKTNDVITVELNANELRFMCNGLKNGLAFNVDNKRNYVLAVAFCNNRYDLQIYD